MRKSKKLYASILACSIFMSCAALPAAAISDTTSGSANGIYYSGSVTCYSNRGAAGTRASSTTAGVEAKVEFRSMSGTDLLISKMSNSNSSSTTAVAHSKGGTAIVAYGTHYGVSWSGITEHYYPR